MDFWVSAILFLLALVALGVAIYFGLSYLAKLRAPKPPPPPPEDPSDLTLNEGVGLDEGTLAGLDVEIPGPKAYARLRFHTRGVQHDVLLDQPVTNIGRGSGNQIEVGDALASRRHARITREEDGEYWVEDCQSANHTFVNGAQIERHKLARDDKIKVGETILTFVRDR